MGHGQHASAKITQEKDGFQKIGGSMEGSRDVVTPRSNFFQFHAFVCEKGNR